MTDSDKIDHRATFIDQYEALREFPLFQRMAGTVEGSPWHREANVLVHTDMVVAEYVKLTDAAVAGGWWGRSDYLGAFSCAFHDTGKPAAEIQKWSEQRGNYRAYHGHELLSARIFETYAVRRYPMFSAEEITMVSWMIEHHMPWSMVDATKLNNLAMTGNAYDVTVFCRALLADQFGRIADDQQAKNERATSWTAQLLERARAVSAPVIEADKPTLIVPIGPSGAGKSTYLANLKQNALRESGRDVRIFSLDALRHEFYDPVDYANAFRLSTEDNTFEARTRAQFLTDVKKCAEDGVDLYVDNTNLSVKRRKWYIAIAKTNGFNTQAVLMPVDLDTVIARQSTRLDKTVPIDAVKQQYFSLQAPMIGEFDSIVVSTHNLTKPT